MLLRITELATLVRTENPSALARSPGMRAAIDELINGQDPAGRRPGAAAVLATFASREAALAPGIGPRESRGAPTEPRHNQEQSGTLDIQADKGDGRHQEKRQEPVRSDPSLVKGDVPIFLLDFRAPPELKVKFETAVRSLSQDNFAQFLSSSKEAAAAEERRLRESGLMDGDGQRLQQLRLGIETAIAARGPVIEGLASVDRANRQNQQEIKRAASSLIKPEPRKPQGRTSGGVEM